LRSQDLEEGQSEGPGSEGNRKLEGGTGRNSGLTRTVFIFIKKREIPGNLKRVLTGGERKREETRKTGKREGGDEAAEASERGGELDFF